MVDYYITMNLEDADLGFSCWMMRFDGILQLLCVSLTTRVGQTLGGNCAGAILVVYFCCLLLDFCTYIVVVMWDIHLFGWIWTAG